MLEDSEAKTVRTKISKTPKKKYSEFHLNVGLGKRIDVDIEKKKLSRAQWDKMNLKKDHLKKFAQKSISDRIL